MEEWRNSPLLKNVSEEKLNLLVQLFEKSKSLKSNELIPFFLSASTKAASEGITFSDNETELILSVLKERMSKEDIKKIDTIRKLAKMINAKKQKK